ncbi:zinc finger BED domain-containing protein 5-like [Palaemon carinicauda]|uniref:zinc finger BED domain-containing protein 5-like n=1 Tax=Palaemon carinicauda TaxID=392227 RepID=UPI0035B59216
MHYMIDRYALAVKALPPDLKTVIDEVVAMVNFIKNSLLNTKILCLCHELNAHEEPFLFHTEVTWLSRGNVVGRVVTLKEELKEFFERNEKEKIRKFVNKLSDKNWITKMAYRNYIFSRNNAVNRSLQSYWATMIDFVDKLQAFQMKLKLWQEKVTAGWYEAYENMSHSLSVLCKDDVNEVSGLIHKHLISPSQELENLFPDITDLDWYLLRNPLKVDLKSLPD